MIEKSETSMPLGEIMDGWTRYSERFINKEQQELNINALETSGDEIKVINIAGGRQEALEEAAEMVSDYWFCYFSCAGVIAGGTSCSLKNSGTGSRSKRELAENHNRKVEAFEEKVKVPEPREWGKKPGIYLASLESLEEIVDYERLEKILGLEGGEEESKNLVKDLYKDSLMHIVLPIKEEHAGTTIPFINEKATTGFMCLGCYPPLENFIEILEQKTREKGNLPLLFMGSSMASRDMESISTSSQALKILKGIPGIRESSILLVDPEMDKIVEEDWDGRGNSQSLVDLTSKKGTALVIRRGVVLPETVKPIFNKYGLKIEYADDCMDLYPNELPPIATSEDWKNFKKNFDNTTTNTIMTEEECPNSIAA